MGGAAARQEGRGPTGGIAIAQLFGAFGSAWYGHLIGTGNDRNTLFAGYVVGAIAMMLGGLAAVFFAVNAEGKSLEDVATPLSVIGKPPQAIFRAGAASSDPGSPVPDPRPADHDDPTRTRDDGTPF
jgi:hypothetical protein